MKPNPTKPINTPTDTKKYVESKKLEILSRLFYIITHTNWSLEYSSDVRRQTNVDFSLRSVSIYVGLTIFRDLRDNFAVELWTELGFLKTPWILVFSEIPIAIIVLAIIGSMILVKNNKKAFYLSISLCIGAGICFLISTFLFDAKYLNPIYWMILMGLFMYLPYLVFHTILFERWLAFFKYKGNLGFLMYMSDSVGYFGSVLVLLYKNYGTKGFLWLPFFTATSWIIGLIIAVLGILSLLYFRRKEKNILVVDF